eukprot:TRINITY_DN419_c0_g1_i15.p1 TRINITY_DN419_c0_g1~~TRINITY_DN419_c0_g1_i15.p1  ORF type:complete len:325 (-),score=58.14 TRINITY_DN419_c0_g1_i15:1148-2122(-)
MVKWFDKSIILMTTAIFPLCVVVTCLFFKEKKAIILTHDEEKTHSKQSQIGISSQISTLKVVWKFMKRREITWACIYVFLINLVPAFDDALKYFYSNELNFDSELLARMSLFSTLAALATIAVYNKWLKNIRVKPMLFTAKFVFTLSSLTLLILLTRTNKLWGIPDDIFALGESVMLSIIDNLSTMPMTVLYARLCPVHIGATMMSAFTSVAWIARIVKSELSALILSVIGVTEKDFSKLWLAYLIGKSMMIIPLILLLIIDFERAIKATEEENEKEKKAEEEAMAEEKKASLTLSKFMDETSTGTIRDEDKERKIDLTRPLNG